MHRLLFNNRIGALAFVAFILLGVRILVGTDNDRGALEQATERFVPEQQVAQPQQRARPAPKPVITEFTSDEDLIDDTSGFDPSGWSSEPDVVPDEGMEAADSPPDLVED
ncbi:MAG: hypothetical protein P8J20_16505 [Novosphingobium sp.]|nr:hypothetical protein [Novosphingobium sp.]